MVKRLDFCCVDDFGYEAPAHRCVDDDGGYVEYEEYQKLKQENARLRGAAQEVVDTDKAHRDSHIFMSRAQAQHVIDSETTAMLKNSLEAGERKRKAIDALEAALESSDD